MVLYPILTCFVSVKLLFGFLIHSLVFLHSVIEACMCVCVCKRRENDITVSNFIAPLYACTASLYQQTPAVSWLTLALSRQAPPWACWTYPCLSSVHWAVPQAVPSPSPPPSHSAATAQSQQGRLPSHSWRTYSPTITEILLNKLLRTPR